MRITTSSTRLSLLQPLLHTILLVVIFLSVMFSSVTHGRAIEGRECNSDATSFSGPVSAARDSSNLCQEVTGDLVYILKSPSRMSKTDGLKILVLAGLTVGLMSSWDEDVDANVGRGADEFPYPVIRLLGELGQEYGRDNSRVVIFFAGLSGSMLAGGLALKDDKLLSTTALLAESFAFTMLATFAVKMTAGRDRPYLENGPRAFEYFQFSSDKAKRSLPSGHASAAFAMMTVIAKKYPTWWVSVPAYTIAVGAGLARIETRQHWTSDVVLGAALGYFISSAVVERRANRDSALTSPIPLISPGRVGIAFRF